MSSVLSILFGALLTTATSLACGELLLRALRVRCLQTERYVFSFIVGSASLSIIVFGLGLASQVRAVVFAAVGVCAICLTRLLKPAAEPFLIPSAKLSRRWLSFFAIVAVPFLWLYLATALAPESSPDGMAYHLGLVARYFRHHQLERIPGNMFANISQGLEMLFLYAFAFGRHSAAALVHFTFLLALISAMVSYGRRFGFPLAGLFAAILVFTSAIVGLDSVIAYNDVALAAAVFSSFYLLQIWKAERQVNLLLLAGLCAGFAFAIKYTGILAILYGIAFVLIDSRRRSTAAFTSAAIFSASSLLLALPWLVKNWLWVGNPVAPVFNGVFRNPYFTIAFEKQLDQILSHWQGLTLLRMPLEVTLHGSRAGGVVGPIFLICPIALLALRSFQGRALLSAAIVMALPVIGNKETRFLIPALPFLALAMGMVLMRARWLGASVILLQALGCWPPLMAFYADKLNWGLHGAPWAAALRLIPEDQYLTQTNPAYRIARMVETYVPPGERAFALNSFAASYCTRDVLVGWFGAENLRLQSSLFTPLDPFLQPAWQYSFRFPARSLAGIRTVQNGRGSGVWSISETRILSSGQAIPPNPQWSVRAFPFPWTAWLAFDGSPMTQWRTNEDLFPGEFQEVLFGGQIDNADEVQLLCSTQPPGLRIRLEVLSGRNAWERLNIEPDLTRIPVSGDLRKSAMRQFFEDNVHYLLVQPGDYEESDVVRDPSRWNLVPVAATSGAHLYRIPPPPALPPA